MGMFQEIAKPLSEIAATLAKIHEVQLKQFNLAQYQFSALTALAYNTSEITMYCARISHALNVISPPLVPTGFRMVFLPNGGSSMPKYRFVMEASRPEDGVIGRQLKVFTVSEGGADTERENVTLSAGCHRVTPIYSTARYATPRGIDRCG